MSEAFSGSKAGEGKAEDGTCISSGFEGGGRIILRVWRMSRLRMYAEK